MPASPADTIAPRHPTLTADEITAMVTQAMPGAEHGDIAVACAFLTITRTREGAQMVLDRIVEGRAARMPKQRSAA